MRTTYCTLTMDSLFQKSSERQLKTPYIGHPVRDNMLQPISNIWWPRIHRDITLLAKSCPNCQEAGTSIKPIIKPENLVKYQTRETNDKIAIDFAGPFKMARSSKKHLIVSIDS